MKRMSGSERDARQIVGPPRVKLLQRFRGFLDATNENFGGLLDRLKSLPAVSCCIHSSWIVPPRAVPFRTASGGITPWGAHRGLALSRYSLAFSYLQEA
jgi:hypothetical protein